MNTFKVKLNLRTQKLKGNLIYEYNPLYNYQTNETLYLLDGKFICPEGKAVNIYSGNVLTKLNGKWVDKNGNVYDEFSEEIRIPDKFDEIYAPAGSLIEFTTDKLNFDLEHPVDIEVQSSYDGSVNLIINDDKNIPRLINTRFSVREKDTYEIVDRIGENDTNIYNSETFDKDTSLYFQYLSNPIVYYKGLINGNLPVGQYCFYFTYCDADNNESDYIAETGVIPVFIGLDGDPFSMDGGIKNLNSNKGIRLNLTNLDKSYNYIKVYYVRYLADYLQNRTYEAKEINNKYPILNTFLDLLITGYENTTDIDANILNITQFNPKSVLALALCKNMLFFGNIVKNTDNYEELSDLTLRFKITPQIKLINDSSYYYNNGFNLSYYNSENIYNMTGYFPEEYYRFGIVYIYNNGTLSNVYNTIGGLLSANESLNILEKIFNDDDSRNKIKVDENGFIPGTSFNARGVCKLPKCENNEIMGIKFSIEELEILNYLNNYLGIRGFFVVRLKRIPTVIAQCYLFPIERNLKCPVFKKPDGNTYLAESFISLSTDKNKKLLLTHTYEERLVEIEKSNLDFKYFAGICPDFLLNLPYYNQIFNGSQFIIEKICDYKVKQSSLPYLYNLEYGDKNYTKHLVRICSVTDNVPSVAIEDQIYKLEVGEAEEAYKFGYARKSKTTDKQEREKGDDAIRGKFSPYLAIKGNANLSEGYYNIRLNSNDGGYEIRMNSSEPYYAISNRYNFNDLYNKEVVCWRGDSYLNTFTYRLNRNFNDSSLPNNDKIILFDTWKKHYVDLEENATIAKEFPKISRSDLNAVRLGSWFTFKIRSSINYALRSEDHSNVAEEAEMGRPRSFYPRTTLFNVGENKIPDSYLYNDAFRESLGYKCYFTLQDINYLKNTFSNRILYSEISILDSYKNNYRRSLSTYFRDYSQEYGSILKLLGFEGYLLVVFEHAIGIAVINERILAGSGDGEPVFINTKNVLPEELTIITDTYGTLWPESVIKSESGYVYGVDTVAKKIWRVKGLQIEILSDFKVNKFLIDNILLEERENHPFIGVRNVKTHYNNNKKDIMFTFYNNVYKDEEKAWNLCYNELVDQFITFYSWIPSYSANIDTTFFSFNRDTSKKLSLLQKSNYYIPENTGVLVTKARLETESESAETEYYVYKFTFIYRTKVPIASFTSINKEQIITEEYQELDGVLFELEHDHWGNYKLFLSDLYKTVFTVKQEDLNNALISLDGILLLEVTPQYNGIKYKTETIAVTVDEISSKFTTYFYIHGLNQKFNLNYKILPTCWYDEIHPFEFEFIVNDKLGLLKIFENLILISNKAEPESFHFEIEGDNYEFSSDKRTMYYRQEQTKELYQSLGSNMLFDRYYEDCCLGINTLEQDYNYIVGENYPQRLEGLVKLVKSTIFPLYYERVDTYNELYDDYVEMTHSGYDFKNLSGSEIKWNKDLNLFNIVTHVKNSPINLVGRLRGNSHYKEGKWNIQIPSIIFNLKNEVEWKTGKPPIIINSSNLPYDLTEYTISKDKIPNIINPNDNINDYIDLGDWTYRKEARIRDKWIKIKVRYSGKNLAIIHSIITLYNISYS